MQVGDGGSQLRLGYTSLAQHSDRRVHSGRRGPDHASRCLL